eukprot:6752410-Pyramimonas_sp.AAC.1
MYNGFSQFVFGPDFAPQSMTTAFVMARAMAPRMIHCTRFCMSNLGAQSSDRRMNFHIGISHLGSGVGVAPRRMQATSAMPRGARA